MEPMEQYWENIDRMAKGDISISDKPQHQEKMIRDLCRMLLSQKDKIEELEALA